jgi:hypothetical protein
MMEIPHREMDAPIIALLKSPVVTQRSIPESSAMIGIEPLAMGAAAPAKLRADTPVQRLERRVALT